VSEGGPLRGLPRDIRFVVVICTRDRCALVADTVRAILPQIAPYPNAGMLIVDNASTDGTPAFLAGLVRRHPFIRAVREPRAGIYFARRTGVLETRDADFLLWIDDDVIPRDGWIEGLLGELLADPALGVIGPAIDAIWECEPEGWFTEHMQRDVPVMSFPSGRQEWCYPCYPAGATLALRGDPCLDFYCTQDRLDHPLGRRPGQTQARTVAGEDLDLSEVYIRAGYKVISVNHVKVGHRILAFKVTPGWLIDKYASDGRLRIRLARLTGRSVLGWASAKMLAALPALALAQAARPFVSQSRSILLRAYLGKAVGAWSEWLFGPRVRPYSYPASQCRAPVEGSRGASG
jgi:glycosyltransferase involved in cell wall biosynthesis